MAIFTGLDRLAAQASASIEGARQNRAQQQADQLRNQRILQQQKFEADLKQRGIDAQNERERKQLAQKKQFHIDDLDLQGKQFKENKRQFAVTAKNDENRNQIARERNIIDRRATDLTKFSTVANSIFGGRERALFAQKQQLNEAASFGIPIDPIEEQSIDAQISGIQRDRLAFIKGGMSAIYPDFSLPDIPIQAPEKIDRFGQLVDLQNPFKQAVERSSMPRQETPAERAAANRNVVSDQKGRNSDSLNTGFTVTGDSSKMRLKKDFGRDVGLRKKSIQALIDAGIPSPNEAQIKAAMEQLR